MGIIRIQKHKLHDEVVTLKTQHELAPMMGRFEPARYDSDAKVYNLAVEHLPAFLRHAKIHGNHQVLDERPRVGVATLGPLPKCRHCGQPASRKVALALTVCPDCGEAWEPKIFREDYEAPRVPPNAAYLAAREQLKGSPITLTPDQW